MRTAAPRLAAKSPIFYLSTNLFVPSNLRSLQSDFLSATRFRRKVGGWDVPTRGGCGISDRVLGACLSGDRGGSEGWPRERLNNLGGYCEHVRVSTLLLILAR
jgi:hypothetical protein